MPKIKINDISMYYEIHGQGEPLVFIAGFSADHLSWGFVLDHFTDKYQVILLDNRGTGQTDVPAGPYTIEQMADDVAALCEKLSLSQAHFVGNSMGGYIVQMLAYRHAALVKSIVICNSAMIAKNCFSLYLRAHLGFLKAGAPRELLSLSVFSWLFSYAFISQEGQLDALIQLSLVNPYPFTITGFEGQQNALNTFDSRAWANEIKVPTLVTGSDQDLIFRAEQSEAIAHQIKHAQYHCFEECGHLPHIEYPEKFVEIVKKFLDQ